jgi:hypothetical protein
MLLVTHVGFAYTGTQCRVDGPGRRLGQLRRAAGRTGLDGLRPQVASPAPVRILPDLTKGF